MSIKTIGIGELAVSKSPGETLITYALGPCLGVVALDTVRSIGGLVHCQLPLSLDDKPQAMRQPARYVDTGVSLLLEEMQRLGAKLESVTICVAGGAQVLDADSVFKIAQRNHSVFRKLMWKNGLLIAAEDIGGTRPRTMSLDIGSGVVAVVKDQERHVIFDATKNCISV